MVVPLFDPLKQKSFLSKLYLWYRKEGRHDMPWRETHDPYAILVSEFMLQQTTVATVRPYYDRFLKKFPTLKSLAQADLNDVLALWSGLGYYARARNLWSSMKTIQAKWKGKIPHETENLITLPGVGYYTAGAIVSLAYNRPAAVLDGNIIRVVMRLLGLEDDPKLKAIQVLLRKACLELTQLSFRKKKSGAAGPREVVLSLMDLGASLCSPTRPQCSLCPVASFCQAQKFGRQEVIPPPKEQTVRPMTRYLYGLVQIKGKWLFAQRPKSGLFGGLWEFPGTESTAGTNPVDHLEDHFKTAFGLPIRVREAIPAFEHQLSHKTLVNRPYLCVLTKHSSPLRLPKKNYQYQRFKWVWPAQTKRFGISAITKKILSQLERPQPT